MIDIRLREERERLGLSQPVFAHAAGAAKRTLADCEKGVSSPTAVQLSALSKIGVDVLYILTGQRSQALGEAELLAPDERIMLDNYRHAPDPVRAGVKKTLGYFAPGGGSTHDGAGVKRAA